MDGGARSSRERRATHGSRLAGCGRACSRCRSPACPPSSTASGSRTSPTSTWACHRGHLLPPSEPELAAARKPDPSGSPATYFTSPWAVVRRRLLERLGPAYAALGNDDRETPRSVSQPVELLEPGEIELLADESCLVELRIAASRSSGSIPGSTARDRNPERHVDPGADLRTCSAISAWPGPSSWRLRTRPRRPPPRGAQVCSTQEGHSGRASFSPEDRGIYRYPGATLHVSPGVGTTFVLFRFCARPEATELVLRRPGALCCDDYLARHWPFVDGHGVDFDGHPRPLRRRCGERGAGVLQPVGIGLHRHALHRHDGARATREGARVAVELHVALDWGASAPGVGAVVQALVSDHLAKMADVRPDSVDVVVDDSTRPSARGWPTATKVEGLTGATLRHAPSVCHECVFW